MAVYDQQITSYDDLTPHVRVVGDVIKLITPYDAPVVARLGLNSAREKFRLKLDGYKIEILEDELDPVETTLSNGTVDLTTTTLSFGVADASFFQVGHVILVDAEKMVVSAVNTGTNVITVYSRTYGGTRATHEETASLSIVGMARLEGADASFGPAVDIAAPYNYTSIFQKGLNVSGTMQAIDQYGIADEFAYQANKAMPHLMRLVERAFFHGVRQAGSETAPRSFGGVDTFVTNNSSSITTTITKASVDNLAKLIYDDGGSPNMLVVNPAAAARLRGLIDSSSFVRLGQENTVFGMQPVTRVSTQFYGDLELVTSRWCPPKKAYMLDSNKIGFYTLRDFFMKQLAVTGDSVKGEVVGELSLIAGHDAGHGYIVTSGTSL